jgi:pSer/pThr/pTyr-binding forkhead associated (FHA) protein
MDAYLEVWGDAGADIVGLTGDRVVLGRAASNDVALTSDPTASRVHAVLEHYPSGWSIRDMGTVNGTLVNGELVGSEQALHPGDEIRIGATRIVFRAQTQEVAVATVSATDKPPVLTRRERDVLVALCRPVVGPGTFTQPATMAEIAQELVISEATVKFHLGNLYDKFDIYEPGPSRRARLAEAALTRGAVQRTELRQASERRSD